MDDYHCSINFIINDSKGTINQLSDEIKEKVKYIFAESSEEYISSLGNGYIKNFVLHQTLSKGFAIISSKRVYFKGVCYYQNHKGKLRQQFTEEVVDLKDITGTGYKRVNPLSVLFAGIVVFVIAVILLIAAINIEDKDVAVKLGFPAFLLLLFGPGIALVVYKLYAINHFEISYAGGKIAFDVNYYYKAEIDDFQRQLRRAKDNISSLVSVQAVNISNASAGVADEIKKYAELLQQGAITQEEYEQLKKELISNRIK